MKKYLFLFLMLSQSCFFSSCIQKMLLKKVGAFDENAITREISNGDKIIVFVPMHHVGKQSFYADVKRKIDSLHNNGYVVYYEGTKPDMNVDSLTADTLKRKLRMITGIDPVLANKYGGYVDTVTNTFMGSKSKYIKSEKLRNQPSAPALGIHLVKDVRADVFFSDIINAYELKYGKLQLTECDLQTPLGQKYRCKKTVKRKEKLDILLNSRNEFLSNAIVKEERKNMAVVFGAKHFKGLLKMLQEKDPAWKKVH